MTADKARRSEVEAVYRQHVQQLLSLLKKQLQQIVQEAERQPQSCGSAAVARLRHACRFRSASGSCPAAALVFCFVGRLPLKTASNLARVFLAGSRPAIAAQPRQVEQLLAANGGVLVEGVEVAAAWRRAPGCWPPRWPPLAWHHAVL